MIKSELEMRWAIEKLEHDPLILSDKQTEVMVMVMDALPRLKSFFGIELELGIKIFSLVNIANSKI